MYQQLHNASMVKKVFLEATNVTNAIPHPRTMGVIREFGGKMYMEEKDWEAAQVNFFQAFRNYDEAGSSQRIQVLKILFLPICSWAAVSICLTLKKPSRTLWLINDSVTKMILTS